MNTSCDRPHGALTVFYDASCAVCALEMDALRARTSDATDLRWCDISAAGFDASAHGFAHADLDAALHVVDADGAVARGVDALAIVYRRAGLGNLVAALAVPGVRPLADAGYRTFARHRRAISRWLAPALARLRRHRERAAAARNGAQP